MSNKMKTYLIAAAVVGFILFDMLTKTPAVV
jgi:hypothetical protein